MKNIVVATIHEWNLKNYDSWMPQKGVKKNLISTKESLTFKKLKKNKPDFIFFPHWSWKIPEDIYKNFNCIVFHMTDLPYGKGGTPLQNLIIRGIYNTKISAIKVTEEIDGGPVYIKKNFSIKLGSAQEIYERASKLIFKMIDEIIRNNPVPIAQTGKTVTFKRRTPSQSLLPKNVSLRQLYDFIRMLDADRYPYAYLEFDNFKFVLKNAKLDNNEVHATVLIKKKGRK